MQMFRRLPVLAVLGVFAFSLPVHAQEGQQYRWSVEARSGAYWPKSDEWKEVYGDEAVILSEIHLRYQVLPRLELGGAVGFTLSHGTGQTSTGQSTDQEFTMYLVPLQLEGVYRFDFLPEQLLVPYLTAGLDLWLYRETEDDSSRKWSGARGGFHGGAGVQLLLDRLDPEGARLFYETSGIINSLIVLEGRYVAVDGFGSNGLDLSGWIIQAGLCFQF